MLEALGTFVEHEPKRLHNCSADLSLKLRHGHSEVDLKDVRVDGLRFAHETCKRVVGLTKWYVGHSIQRYIMGAPGLTNLSTESYRAWLR